MKIIYIFLFFVLISSSTSFALTCDSTMVGTMQYDPVGKNMQLCDGSSWKSLGGGMGAGTGCHWQSWGSSGQSASGNSNLYVSPTGGNYTGSAGYCNLTDYAAAVVGDGITTGGKRDFGQILCCPLGGG